MNSSGQFRGRVGQVCATPAKECTLRVDLHIISFDQVDTDLNQALSFFGDGVFGSVKISTDQIPGRLSGTKYTEGLAATYDGA